MYRASKAFAMLVVFVFASCSIVAADDLTIVSQVTPSKGQPTTSTQYITADKMRVSDGKTDTIVNLGEKKIVQIDHKKKKYYEITFDEMRAHFAKMEQMLDANPMMEQMMGKVSDVEVQETSETKEIVGFSCTKYLISMGDNIRQILWVTPDLEMPLEYYDASKAVYAMMGPMGSRFVKMVDAMKEIKGFSLATEMDMKVMGMDASSKSMVTEVKSGPVPADAFAVPSGYKKKKSPLEE